MSNYKWKKNNEQECWELIEVDAIIDDDEKLDAIVARIYDVAEFVKYCSNPVFPPYPGTDPTAEEVET